MEEEEEEALFMSMFDVGTRNPGFLDGKSVRLTVLCPLGSEKQHVAEDLSFFVQ
jgi:hypothetical protein